MQFLRHVADPQSGFAPYAAMGGLEQPEHGFDQRGFTGAVGAYKGNDLARLDTQLDIVEHRLARRRSQ